MTDDLRAGSEEVCALDKLVDLGSEVAPAALFRGAGQREGIARRFREGEVLVRHDGRPAPRAEAVQEMVLGEGEGWIGVEPTVDLGLHPLGLGGGSTPEG